MRVLVLGASGATGRLVVRQFMKRKINCRVLIRESAVFPDELQGNSFVEILVGNVNELSDFEMTNLVDECNVIISCLGHNITFKGMFGKPRNLVLDAVKRISETVQTKDNLKVKFILMGTTGYTNTSVGEANSVGEKMVHLLLRFLPPHQDNIKAANYLITEIGETAEKIEWVIVRPDTLVNDDEESSFEVFPSPVRSPLFNAGKTSRINVSQFMAELVTIEERWNDWRYKTPVLYNTASLT